MHVYYLGQMSVREDGAMTELAKHFRELLRDKGWSYRVAADELGLTRAIVENAVNDKTKPELETLRKIANAIDLPLWRVVQMSGVDLDLPKTPDERAQRLVSIAKKMPQYQAIVDHLLDLPPDDADGILIHLEGIALRRARQK